MPVIGTLCHNSRTRPGGLPPPSLPPSESVNAAFSMQHSTVQVDPGLPCRCDLMSV